MSSPGADRARILVLIKGLGIGGAERLISEAAPYWDRERFDYRVAYVLPWKDQLVSELVAHQVPVRCLGSKRGLGPATLSNLRTLLAEWRPNLIHAHLPSTGILARLAAGGTPLVYTEHNLADSYRQPTRTLNRLTYRRNRAVVAVSQAVADSLREFPGPAPRVIPNGVACHVSPQEAAAARRELGLAEGQPLVVHVGNIRPHKGHETLIAATAAIHATRPEAVVVSIGGEKHSGDLERLRARAREAGVNGSLRFLGRREDARAFLAAADVVVNPSDVEGLPVSLLEALALHRPVVATAVGGVPALIEDGVTGRLVPPGDPAALAQSTLQALADGNAARWGERGAQLVAERYGLAPMVAAYESLYREVLGG